MKKNYFKLGVMAVFMMAASVVSAQQTTGDITTQTAVSSGTDSNGSIRVIDNKGTIKYLQSSNGITTLSNTTSGVTTTTWQLGGTLTNDTYIDANGNAFGFNGIQEATTSATATISGADGNPLAAETGWALMVREEATGNIQTVLASDLVSGIRVEDMSAATGADIVISVLGLPALTPATTMAKLFVYRNGVKLRTGDFTAAVDQVTINNSADLTVVTGDVIEIQYIK